MPSAWRLDMTAPRIIELIAPSGYPQDWATVERALARLHEQGHEVKGLAAAKRRYQRFGGTDRERAADLNRLAEVSQPLPDVVLAVRGGYGAIRLLPELDYKGLARRLREAPIVLSGHSDFTAIQLALLARSGVMTFGGPMLTANFGAPEVSAYTMDRFWSTVTQPSFTLIADAAQAQTLDVTGILWGGNLATLVALVGTPYMPRVQGGILFIEDINEPPYRIERLIYQLHLAGILAEQQALVLGDFSGAKTFAYDNGYDLNTVIEQVRTVAHIPVITGLPFGHIDDIATMPVGASAHLVSNAHGFRLTVSGYPYL
jgi:muramoyltetrapeptide carboxypeptidase